MLLNHFFCEQYVFMELRCISHYIVVCFFSVHLNVKDQYFAKSPSKSPNSFPNSSSDGFIRVIIHLLDKSRLGKVHCGVPGAMQ